jgi:hypothetical protein
MKPSLSQVTLCVIDTTNKVHLASRAIAESLKQASFGAVKLLTNDVSQPHAVKIKPLNNLTDYSEFCVKELHRYIDTPFCIVAQWDGYMLNSGAWTDDFLNWDYIGSPWLPSNVNGNGGWSLRSKKLLEACAKILKTSMDSPHPEDAWVCMTHRKELEEMGCKFAPIDVCKRWGFEGRSYNRVEWESIPNEYSGQCGFHSWLTKLPKNIDRPKVYHSSGDAGDVIYGCPVIKALGAGVLFLSPHNLSPYPLNSRWARMGGDPEWVNNLKPLLESQPYIWRAQYTHKTPFSVDHDLNSFRKPWRDRTALDFESILALNCRAFNLPLPSEPWLRVNDPIVTTPIVVNRTARYQNWDFPWTRFIEKFHRQMTFVGTPQEYEVFCGFAPHCKFHYRPTKDALELARVIAGARLFAGNQSLALAIAHGLYKKVMVECWPKNSNCEIVREGAIYGVPEELKA